MIRPRAAASLALLAALALVVTPSRGGDAVDAASKFIKADGHLEIGPKGKTKVHLLGWDRAFEVDERTRLKTGSLPVPCKIEGQRDGFRIRLTSVKSKLTDDWFTRGRELDPAKYKDLIVAYSDLAQVADKAETSGDGLTLATVERTAYGDKIETAWVCMTKANLTAAAPDQKVLAELTANLFYQRHMVKTFAAWTQDGLTYPQQRGVFLSEDRCAAVADTTTGRVRASGVLIGHDLFVTCHHKGIAADAEAGKLEVWFKFYEDTPEARAQIVKFPVRRVASSSEKLDYAVLVLGPAAGGGLPASKGIVPAKLSRRRLGRGERVYAVGHPAGGVQHCHNNARVLFPYQLTDADHALMRESMTSYFEANQLLQERALKLFDAYYVNDAEYRKVFEVGRWLYRANDLPSLGTDCAIDQGNSGCPAFDLVEHSVVAICSEGRKPEHMKSAASWLAHERFVPVVCFVGLLQRDIPDWQQRGVVFGPGE